jgi:hypothetical protein
MLIVLTGRLIFLKKPDQTSMRHRSDIDQTSIRNRSDIQRDDF